MKTKSEKKVEKFSVETTPVEFHVVEIRIIMDCPDVVGTTYSETALHNKEYHSCIEARFAYRSDKYLMDCIRCAKELAHKRFRSSPIAVIKVVPLSYRTNTTTINQNVVLLSESIIARYKADYDLTSSFPF